MISLLNLVIFGIIFLISWKVFRKSGKFPKGPRPIPIMGNALALGAKPHLTFKKWADQYGKIYQMYIGKDRHFVLSDPELIKKALQHPSIQGRPRVEVTELDGANHGIALTSGQEWQDQRRFTLRHLRDFGFGKNYMEPLILEEVDELLDWIKSQGNTPFSLNTKFALAVVNSLWRIIAGQRFNQTDPKLQAIFHKLFLAGRNVNTLLVLFMPGLAKAFPNKSGWNKIREVIAENIALVDEPINQHRAEFTKENQENPRDFIDAYLGEINKTTDPKSSFYGRTGEKSLSALALDLFQGGSLTTSTALAWSVLFMVVDIEIQKKFQKEIDEVIGQSRRPSMSDKPNMIYTEALTCEVLRKSSLLPFGVFHAATENITFEGYDVPKGTLIVSNQYYVHHDPKIWGDPENFRPERFISSEGKIQMKENLIPFSTGKRMCPGEGLARDEFFLFITSLFQRFEIRADPSKPMPTTEGVPIYDVLESQEFFVTVKDRRD